MVDISPNIPLEPSLARFNVIIPVYTLNNPSSLLVDVLIASAFCEGEQDLILKINSAMETLEPCFASAGGG